MMYTFTPGHLGEVAYAYQSGPLLRSGDVVELDAAQAARLIDSTAGVNGGDCLIPTAAADFMAAISAPTAMNPETDPETVHSEADNDAAPARRGRGRPKKSGK
jgi:hypothetical protein